MFFCIETISKDNYTVNFAFYPNVFTKLAFNRREAIDLLNNHLNCVYSVSRQEQTTCLRC